MVAVRRRSARQAAPAYTRADVEAQSVAGQEPDWLLQSRLRSWEIYETLPMPSSQDEEWRRTDYGHIRWEEAEKLLDAQSANVAEVPAENLEPLIGEAQGGLLVFVNGQVVRYEIADTLAAAGVIFTDLRSASREHPELVRENLMTRGVRPEDGKFAALHGALWTHGVFLYVPRNVVVELPLHVVMYNTADGASMGHVLAVVEENAQATLVVDYASAQGQQHSVYVGATELLVGQAANLRYVALQDWNRQTFEFSHNRARIDQDANLDWIVGTIGGELVKAFLEIDIDGKGANGRMSGFFFADKDQLFDLDTQQSHNAPLTTSDLLFKGAAKDTARTVWQGMIKSLPQMQKIDGFQACRNLLLSDDARMDAIPGLEIEADDVACSHAATFGTLEAEPIYYLMSRGIPRSEAEVMLSEGFFDELLQRIPFERVRDRLHASLHQKIIGG